MKRISNILNSRNLMSPQDTYSLRGVLMLMIMVHHVVKAYVEYPEYASIWRWGDLGTGRFFFISGWGLYLSMQKEGHLNVAYLWRNLKKLICPFLVICLFAEFLIGLNDITYFKSNISKSSIFFSAGAIAFCGIFKMTNSLLNYIGHNSLFFYLFHIATLPLLVKLLSHIMGGGKIAICIIILVLMTLIFSRFYNFLEFQIGNLTKRIHKL